jgi:SAM-dependent methyltransferase
MRGNGFLARLVGFVARRPLLSRMLFNRVFKTDRAPQEHNRLVEGAVRSIEPGKALDVTIGQGRNAVFLALRGWDVTGFDVSQEGLSRAREVARRSRVNIHVVQSTSEEFDYGVDRWDLLLLCYAWAPVSNPAYAARLKQSLKNSGLVVFEHFLHDGPDSAPKAAGAPDPGELSSLFADFEILRYEEVTGVPDWEPPLRESVTARLVRMIARKPGGDQ